MEMIDTRDEDLEIKISNDGKTVWVNNRERCLLRAQNTQSLTFDDERFKKQEFLNISPRANWMFMGLITGGIAVGTLFNSPQGTIVGAFIGAALGYLFGRRIERSEK